jgi:S1-C subfamily serine protease
MRALLPLTILASLLSACASAPVGAPPAPQDYPQAYYRTGAPLRDISEDLERTLPSVLRVRVRGTYDTYVFEEVAAPTLGEVRRDGDDVLARAAEPSVTALTQAGTAIVVAAVRRRGTLVTTEHAITLPDTTVVYFSAPETARPGARLVQSISILKDQANTLVAPAFVESFEILGSSSETDLAVLGVELSAGVDVSELRAIRVGAGDPGRLSWGSLVYVLGHPAGYQMVTRAIVSRPDLGPRDRFLTDGLLNEGASGAPILAVRGDSEELEWVGIASAAASRTELRLEAGGDPLRPHGPPTLYDGPVYLSQSDVIRYGITFSIPVGDVREILAALRPWLAELGYPIPRLF